MKTEIYSHNNASAEVNPIIRDNLLGILSSTKFKINSGCAEQLRRVILSQLKEAGWSDNFRLDVGSQISLTSSLDGHVLCFQTGNMSRFYADLLKLQYVYKRRKARAAFYLLPSKESAKKIGSNIAHFERFTFELNLFKDIVTIPTLVIGLK